MKKFEMQYRVAYADTDSMKVVYYANYLTFFERHRTEFLRHFGLPYSELEKSKVFLPVSEAYCNYRAPAHYDDLLTFSGYVEDITACRIKMVCEIYRDDTLLADGYVVLACTNEAGRPVRIPADLYDVCS